MSIEEFEKAKAELKKKYEADLKKLNRDFAMSRNPYKVGDFLKGSSGIFRIDVIKWRSNGVCGSLTLPEPVYEGIAVNKNGTISKRNSTRCGSLSYVTKVEIDIKAY